jgi:hypothetical protein
MYESMYDEKHRFHVLHRDPSVRSSLLQKGLREPLLCSACEQQLGRYERYVSIVLNGGIELEHERRGNIAHVRGVNYKEFRLFQLSILWRAGISSLDFFCQVNLGPHESVLRSMILAEDVSGPDRFPCLVAAIVHDDKVQKDLMIQPVPIRSEGIAGYRFTFGGLIWVFLVASHRHPKRGFATLSLDPAGELRILVMQMTDVPFIKGFAETLAAHGKV